MKLCSSVAVRLCLIVLQAVVPTSAFAQQLTTELITDNIPGALYVAAPAGDFNRIFIMDLYGSVWLVKSGVLQNDPFLNIDHLVGNGGERGMLGMAFHPNYAQNGLFYVRYNANSGATTVQRYKVSASNPDLIDPASAHTLLTIANANLNHNAGWIEFGLDGYLYISVGDDVESDNAQDLSNLHGKILRIDVNNDGFPSDPNRNYAIPPGNPLIGLAGADEIWSWGLRNPWRCGFDRQTGDLWIGDVGWFSWEEIDFQPAGLGGSNYGWGCMEGNHCTTAGGCVCNDPGLTLPIFEYSHDYGCAVTGGKVYRGCAMPALSGTYFMGDYCSGRIWSFRYDGTTVSELLERQSELSANWIVAFGEDAQGELYICDADGLVYKIVPVDAAPDENGNGIPDSCEGANPYDVTGDGVVNVSDLLQVISSWGQCGQPKCPCDFNSDSTVNVHDLLTIIANWG